MLLHFKLEVSTSRVQKKLEFNEYVECMLHFGTIETILGWAISDEVDYTTSSHPPSPFGIY